MLKNKDNTKRFSVQVGNWQADFVRVSLQGNYAEVVGMCKQPQPGIRRINRDLYEVLSTGEVKEFQKNEQKGGWSFRQTLNKLTALIRCNIKGNGATNELFLTLTYKENMQDPERLHRDYVAFYKRLKRLLKGNELGYISVAEPQGRGAWHLHVMLQDVNGKNLYIARNKLSELWGHGMTQVERIDAEEPGAYFTEYFTNIQPHKWDIAESPKAKHMKEKASRLHFYPMGFNFYRASRNMKKPEVWETEKDSVINEFPALQWSKSYDIIDTETGEVIQKIEHQTRKK